MVLGRRQMSEQSGDEHDEKFPRTTESGCYPTWVNSFPPFSKQLHDGDIIPDAKPKRVTSLGAIEQWDAHRAIGHLTAKKRMDRSTELACEPGIGLDPLSQSNQRHACGSLGCAGGGKVQTRPAGDH
ncbi:Ldh family oxidoreductase, partial [Salmonella enterica]|uniref:Ldh family oxidoreductase n=1 Tax=Salmonella enterica TaxID=28901 RepID=UPI00398C5FA9